MKEWEKDPTLPRTKAERESGVLIGYIPEVDAGRYNCRHAINWISKELALVLRPDAKKFVKAA